MRKGVSVGAGNDWRTSLEKVQIAESLGCELVTTGESWSPSLIPWMTFLAMQTEGIQIGTEILNVFSRTPGAIIQEFAALVQLTNGRMVCGQSSSRNTVIRHGTTVNGWEFHTLSDDTFTTHWFILLIPRMTL